MNAIQTEKLEALKVAQEAEKSAWDAYFNAAVPTPFEPLSIQEIKARNAEIGRLQAEWNCARTAVDGAVFRYSLALSRGNAKSETV